MHASSGVQAARSQFKDFDDYREDIATVIEAYPGIDIAHAYILAKGIKGAQVPAKNQTDSEKPSRSATRSLEGFSGVQEEATRKSSVVTPTRGIKGFRGILSEGIDKVLSVRK